MSATDILGRPPRGESFDVFGARMLVRNAAMLLARRGLSAETIREYMRDLGESEAEHAIAWAEEDDRRMALADREDFADECAVEAAKEREAAE